MLKPVKASRTQAVKGKFVIVASQYNSRYVDAMLRAAKAELTRARANLQIVRVPGAYEIPVVAKKIAAGKSAAAIICLGVILRGETTHAAHIGEAVSNALMQIQLAHEIPVIHEVLLLENKFQADVRCLSPEHNRGIEAAQTAVHMAELMRRI